jgi:hypothetical protein
MSLSLLATATTTAATPGIFWVSSGLRDQYKDVFPYSSYVKWYETYHIPDWMGAKPGAITSGFRYQALDPNLTTPFLVNYKYPDIADLNAPEFGKVALTHPSLPEGGVLEIAQFLAMSGPHIETWRNESTGYGILF